MNGTCLGYNRREFHKAALLSGSTLSLGTATTAEVEVLYLGVAGEAGIEAVIAIDLTACSVIDTTG